MNEDKIISMLSTLIEKHDQDFAELKREITAIKQDVAEIKSVQAEHGKELASLKTLANRLDKEVGVITQCVNESYRDQKRLEQKVDKLDQGVNTKLDELKEITELKSEVSVLRTITADNMYDIKALKLSKASSE